MKLSIETQVGTLRGECDGEPHMRAVVGPVLGAVFEPGRQAREIQLGATRAWFKGSHLSGRARLRYTLRQRLLLRPAPSVREYKNLEWLRERLFQAPRPLVGGVLERHGFPTYQFLATELVEDALPLDRALASEGAEGRLSLIEELAREVARLHALHFAHRDLFPRNVLAAPAGAPRRLYLIDCWKGGTASPLRGTAYDLGCLMLDGATLFTAREQQRFFELYFAERAVHAKSPRRDKLLAAAAKHRKKWLERVAKDPGRWRQKEPPAPDWDWRAL